jgi:hypothetical protein
MRRAMRKKQFELFPIVTNLVESVQTGEDFPSWKTAFTALLAALVISFAVAAGSAQDMNSLYSDSSGKDSALSTEAKTALGILKTRVKHDVEIETGKISDSAKKNADEIAAFLVWIKQKASADVEILEKKIAPHEFERIADAKEQIVSRYSSFASRKREGVALSMKKLAELVNARIENEARMFLPKSASSSEIEILSSYIKELTGEVSLSSRSAEVILSSKWKEVELFLKSIEE